MVFSSYLFFFYFLPLALFVYYLLPKWGRHTALTILSYIFYGWANPYFVFLMFGTTLVTYLCGLTIVRGRCNSAGFLIDKNAPRSRTQKTALFISVVLSLSVLGFFKYFNFFLENYNALVRLVGLDSFQWKSFLRVTLPLGISFYTFQAMSYPIDVYRGDAPVERNFIRFACYVSMFPQLVAGPIIRFREVAAQLVTRTHTLDKFARGVGFVAFGLAKKVLLANTCAKIADTCFDSISLNMPDAWYGAVAYSFQIYFDFSGYSDIAIGLGLMLGFIFPKNFDSPYLSQSITEFWQRWHISLSTWLRDYLYIPLGGNRKGNKRTYANLAIVMLLGGLWHGASWNFVIWGAMHGCWLSFERMLGKDSFYRTAPRPVKIIITFFIVTVSWVFFRSPDLPSACAYLTSMFLPGPVHPATSLMSGLIYQPLYVMSFCVAAAVIWAAPQTWDFTKKMTWPKAVWCAGVLILALTVMTSQAYNPFIYFIF